MYQYSIDGMFIKEWDSAKLIEDTLGYSNGYICACCLRKRKQAYGYIWRHNYVDKVEPIKIGQETIPIYQYSLDGEFIREWESAKQVEKELGFADTNISVCCKGKQHMACGYIWRYEKTDRVEPIKTYSQYDLNGNYIQTFNGVPEASKALGYKHLPIIQVCNGVRKQAGGFMWSYEKKDKIESYKKNKRVALNKRKVFQYNLDGSFVAEWESIALVVKSIGVSGNSAIIKCMQGQRKSAYGYIWKDEKGAVD